MREVLFFYTLVSYKKRSYRNLEYLAPILSAEEMEMLEGME